MCVVNAAPHDEGTRCWAKACQIFFWRWWWYATVWFSVGMFATLVIGGAVQDYRSATQIYHAPVHVTAGTLNGERVLSVHFSHGDSRRECRNTTQWLLSKTLDDELVKVPFFITVNGIRQQNDPAFDAWLPVPRYVTPGLWGLSYKTASTCSWLLWEVTTIWMSEIGSVEIPG
jgi:hypothetical protein